MAISKRLRFEILRRDGFKCRYCHAAEVLLTVDHVTPKSLGGTDHPTNLVASCDDCNTGKSSTGTVAARTEVADDEDDPGERTVFDDFEDGAGWPRLLREPEVKPGDIEFARGYLERLESRYPADVPLVEMLMDLIRRRDLFGLEALYAIGAYQRRMAGAKR